MGGKLLASGVEQITPVVVSKAGVSVSWKKQEYASPCLRLGRPSTVNAIWMKKKNKKTKTMAVIVMLLLDGTHLELNSRICRAETVWDRWGQRWRGVLLQKFIHTALRLFFLHGWCCRDWGAGCWGTAASGWNSTTTGPAKILAGTPTAGRSWKITNVLQNKEVKAAIRRENASANAWRLTVPPRHTSRSRGLWQTDRTDSRSDPHILQRDASQSEHKQMKQC